MKRTARALAKLLERQFDETRRNIPSGNLINQLPAAVLPPSVTGGGSSATYVVALDGTIVLDEAGEPVTTG